MATNIYDESESVFAKWIRDRAEPNTNGRPLANAWRSAQYTVRDPAITQMNGYEISPVYYPPYHSKYNPIERCWLSALEKKWNGGSCSERPLKVAYPAVRAADDLGRGGTRSVKRLPGVNSPDGVSRVPAREMKLTYAARMPQRLGDAAGSTTIHHHAGEATELQVK